MNDGVPLSQTTPPFLRQDKLPDLVQSHSLYQLQELLRRSD